MVIEQGVVKSRSETGVWVSTSPQSACMSCAAKSGCGTRVLARFSESKNSVHVTVNQEVAVGPGDVVEIGVAEHAVVIASLLSYIIPLLGLVVGAVAMSRMGDFASALGAGFGLLLGALLARFAHRICFSSLDFEPKFLGALNPLIASDKTL